MIEPLALDLDLPETVTAPPAIGLTFVVWGEPIPKGSTKAFVVKGRARVTNDNPRTRNWQALITDAAQLHVGDEPPLTGPLEVTLRFTLPRPKTVKRPHPIVKPDIDKLARAGLDALTGCVFLDDAQVLSLSAGKVYVGHPSALRQPGLVVEVVPVLT
jgi:crossover junction endodeoxyribonuclease RusA